MKKIIFSILLIICNLIIIGCGKEQTAKEVVAQYLDNYITLDSNVILQMDEFVDNENLTDEQKEVYKDVLKKEYSSLTYDIQSERYENDNAYVKTKINVIDLYKVQREALNYYNSHIEEFNNDYGVYDKNLFINYKLNEMKKAKETINYEIEFKLEKENDKWKVVQLSNDDLEKIHGIYSYEE